MKPTRSNFCTPIRDALTLAGYSYVKALNVCNSELGKATHKSTGEDKTGSLAIKRKQDLFSVTVTPGSEKYVGKLNDAIEFMAFNDAIAKAEKLCPTMTVTVGNQFQVWLDKVAKAETKEELAKA